MSNRTELLAACRRRLPTRIPYTYDATGDADARFRAYLGLTAEQHVADYFGCNRFTNLWSAFGASPQLPGRMARLQAAVPAGVLVDTWGIQRAWVQAGQARYLEIVKAPLANAETVADIEAYDWPKPADVSWPAIPAGFDLAAWKADRVVLDTNFLCPFGIPWALRGMEQMMIDLITAPEMVEAMVAQVEAFTMPCLEQLLSRYPGGVDLIGSGDDYGSQQGLLISKPMIDRFFMPSLRRHYDLGRRYGTIGYHHCCGAIFEMIPSFIAAGVEVLNPIQTGAVGMVPERLKAAYGRDLAFHGAMDIQSTLVTGTPADVRAEVRHRIDTLGPAGYILSPSHSLQVDTPPENLVALYEEARSYGAQRGSGAT